MTTTDSQDRPPERCENMAEVRAEIDRIDRALVKLLSERQRYIERAAEIKSDRATVRDEVRVEDVLAKVLAEARKAGLNAEIAEPVWRTLVERSIAFEFKAFDEKVQRSK
jgi:isochorismate pyruvate lyase